MNTLNRIFLTIVLGSILVTANAEPWDTREDNAQPNQQQNIYVSPADILNKVNDGKTTSLRDSSTGNTYSNLDMYTPEKNTSVPYYNDSVKSYYPK